MPFEPIISVLHCPECDAPIIALVLGNPAELTPHSKRPARLPRQPPLLWHMKPPCAVAKVAHR